MMNVAAKFHTISSESGYIRNILGFTVKEAPPEERDSQFFSLDNLLQFLFSSLDSIRKDCFTKAKLLFILEFHAFVISVASKINLNLL